MAESNIEDMLDHLATMEEEIGSAPLQQGERIVIQRFVGEFRSIAGSELIEEHLTPGIINRYLTAVAMCQAALDGSCDRHELCPFILNYGGKIFPGLDIHCRILSSTSRDTGHKSALSPKIISGTDGRSAGIVLLDGIPSAFTHSAEPGVLAHEIAHLLEGIRNKLIRNYNIAHEVEYLADAGGCALGGPIFTRDFPRYFSRRPGGQRPIWGLHPPPESRLAFVRVSIERIPARPNWQTWSSQCFHNNATATESLHLIGTNTLKYLESSHPFLAELERTMPTPDEQEKLSQGKNKDSPIGRLLENARDCQPHRA